MRRWVYTAMAFSYYSNQVEGKLDFDARLVRDLVGTELVDELIRRASGPRPVGAAIEPGDLAAKKSSSSWFNLLYIAALRRSAKDWLSNRMLTALPMTSDSKIEYHHIFPRAKVSKRYGAELTNSIANLAFISGDSNRKIGSRNPVDYLPEIDVHRLQEQMVPEAVEDWEIDRFQAFLAHRRRMLAEVLNDMLGLRRYNSTLAHSGDTEVPQDDDEIDIETSVREPRRRDVARHILECFEGLDAGVELTVGEIAAAPSSQYDAGEISSGAIRARLEAGTVPGIGIVPNRSPMTARRVGESPPVAAAAETDVPSPTRRTSTYGQPARSHRSGRRDVGQHVKEVFSALPIGTVLSIREIADQGSSQYAPGEISHGAIGALLDRGDPLPGLEEVPGSHPRSVRRRGPSAAGDVETGQDMSGPAELAAEFHREMVQLAHRSEREVNYHPTLFIRMVADHGGVETARRLVMSSTPSDGFTTLWEARRLDLTAEALVVLPRYASIFPDEVIERARQRLGDYGFEV